MKESGRLTVTTEADIVSNRQSVRDKELRVNYENVVKQGLLFKKGEMLGMY